MRRFWAHILLAFTALFLMGTSFTSIFKNVSTNPEYSQGKEIVFKLVDKVNLSLMEDKENFYGYFLFQTSRDIRFDISSPTAVNFKGAKYVIYFNPIIFLSLDMKQMETTIKHEILHILSLHLLRGKGHMKVFDADSYGTEIQSFFINDDVVEEITSKNISKIKRAVRGATPTTPGDNKNIEK